MSRKHKLFTWTSVLVLFAILVSACGNAQPQAGTGEPIKIGAIHDLTGATSDVGTPYADGLKGYVAWKNANGGINGRQIDLISDDYGYKVDEAERLYNEYIGEGIIAFQGWGTGDTEALRSKVAEDKLPFMSASYSANLLDMTAAPYNFLIGTSYSDQAIIALRWALDDWKAKGKEGAPAVVVMHNDSPFGQSPVPDAKAFAEANGMKFTSIAMPKGVTDFVAELSQVKQFGGNYIIIQNVSSPAAVLVKDAKSQGLTDIQVICLNWCADENLIKLAGDAAEGVVGTIPFTPPTYHVKGHEDADAWLKKNGSSLDEKGLHYTQGWWTMAVMSEGIKRVLDSGKDLTGENLKAALETIQNFDTEGITSPISFSSTSHKGNNALRLYEVKDGKWNQMTDFISANP